MDNQVLNQEAEINKIILSQTSISHLKSSAPWMKLVSIIGLIITGVLFFGVLFYGIFTGNERLSYLGFGPLFITYLIYFIFAIIFFISSILLFKNAQSITKCIKTKDSSYLDKAFDYHQRFWYLLGILIIINLSIILIALISVIIFAITN